jgi:hypothetical protein
MSGNRFGMIVMDPVRVHGKSFFVFGKILLILTTDYKGPESRAMSPCSVWRGDALENWHNTHHTMVVVIPSEPTVNVPIALQVILDAALVLTVELIRQATP